MVSMYKFEQSQGWDEEKTDVNEWAVDGFIAHPHKDIWGYYLELWKCRTLPHVLLVVYEDLKEDLACHLAIIAKFMNLPVPAADVCNKILELCSFEWMLSHQNLFDDHHMKVRHTDFVEKFPELAQEKAEGKAR